MKKLVLFGAGKIGRSFIGQLFSRSGFEVVFVDIQEQVISELNRKGGYSVMIKSDRPDKIFEVKNVRGILASDEKAVVNELSCCDLAAVSVGQKALLHVVPLIAKGLENRVKVSGKPLDIILAENMRNADIFVKDLLIKQLGESFPIDALVGLIETSIGKMVPIIPDEVVAKDPLIVYAEPYNTLILDKKAFKNPIPEVDGLAPKENIKAWVDRKSYIHNLGHAAAAYSGFLVNPGIRYLADAIQILVVRKFAKEVMQQSADILMRKYPAEFSKFDLDKHIDDLLKRFENKALGDTVFRVGSDLQRKLDKHDRILSPVIDGIRFKMPVNRLLQTFSYALCFKAKDQGGCPLSGDAEFQENLQKKGLYFVLTNYCNLNPIVDQKVIDRIMSQRWNVNPLKLTVNQVFSPV